MIETKRNPIIDVQATGLRIKEIMRERKLTVKDIQDYLGLVTPQSIYHWFRGRNMPTIDNLYALSELFEVPIDAMVCGNRKGNFIIANQMEGHRLLAYYFVLRV